MNAGLPRCCGNCGRWGNRAYTWDSERETWLCANDRACTRRSSEFRSSPGEQTGGTR